MYLLGTGLFSAEAEGVAHPLQKERNSTSTIKQTPRKRTLNLVEREQRLIQLDRKNLSD